MERDGGYSLGTPVRVGIFYDTKREKGATATIASWMADALKERRVSVEIERIGRVKDLSYDVFIVGSPIYWEKPMETVAEFLSSNNSLLAEKRVAVFIVCMAQLFGGITKRYIEGRYLKLLTKRLEKPPILEGVFKGWLRNPNTGEKENVRRWVENLTKMITKF